MVDSIFFIDSDILKTTNSVGFEISNDPNFDLISESERVLPSTSIFSSRFSAFISRATSVEP